jgi:hypothetical protein
MNIWFLDSVELSEIPSREFKEFGKDRKGRNLKKKGKG